jgi:hypothetical protein
LELAISIPVSLNTLDTNILDYVSIYHRELEIRAAAKSDTRAENVVNTYAKRPLSRGHHCCAGRIAKERIEVRRPRKCYADVKLLT